MTDEMIRHAIREEVLEMPRGSYEDIKTTQF